MAINLAVKYSQKVAELFSRSSFVKPHTSGNMDFTGAKTVRVYKINTVPEVDYRRSGTSRYGDASDVQDTVYEYTVTQDKAFNGIVDKGDESDQTIDNKAGKFLAAQLREVTTPGADKYAFARFAKFAKVVGVPAPSKTNVVSWFADAMESFDNDLVPEGERIAYVSGAVYKLIAQSDEFLKLEKLGEKSVSRGEVGEVFGFTVVKVPTSYLPEGCFFIAAHKSAVCMPYKIAETKIHKDPQGISGALIEGRHYYDAFVFAEKACGVYAAVDSSKIQAAPTISVSGGMATIASAGAAKIMYTLDGSDPRFSEKAEQYSVPVAATSGVEVRAVAFAPDKKFTSTITMATA